MTETVRISPHNALARLTQGGVSQDIWWWYDAGKSGSYGTLRCNITTFKSFSFLICYHHNFDSE